MNAAIDASPARRKRTVRMIYVLLVVAVLIVGFAGYRSVKDTIECSPPSHRELQAQEAFVRAHIGDVGNIELGIADCDDHGGGYMNFTTGLTPTSAQDAFLTDKACSLDDEYVDEIAVLCVSGKFEASIVFEATGAGPTSGQLRI